MIRRIIVGADGTDRSRVALAWSVDLARALPPSAAVQIEVLRALPTPIRATLGVPPFTAAELVEERREEVVKALDSWAAPFEQDGPWRVRSSVVDGDPVATLLEASKDADLLVVGHSRHSSLTGVVLGSVAQRCIAEAPIPVVVVPDAAAPSEHEGNGA